VKVGEIGVEEAQFSAEDRGPVDRLVDRTCTACTRNIAVDRTCTACTKNIAVDRPVDRAKGAATTEEVS